MNAPLISIITPAYNCQNTVEAMVRSVQMQDVQDWELLICDDCSTDETAEVLARLAGEDSRIILLQNPTNSGPAAARNRALDEARGEYVAFLDADDLWLEGKLSSQLALLRETGAALCYTGYTFINADGNPAGITYNVPETITYGGVLVQNVFNCNTVLMRREALGALRFDSSYAHEDFVLWLALLKKGITVRGIARPLACSRLGGRNQNKLSAAKNRWIVYRKSEGLSISKSAAYWCRYAWAALRKYNTTSED